MRIKIDDFTLCDGLSDATQSPASIAVDEERLTQVVKGLRWKASKVLDRQNKETQIRFGITRRFSSIGLAQKFILTHGLYVPNNGLVEFRLFDGSSVYMQASQVRTINGTHTGTTTIHHYNIIGGAIQIQKPL